MKKTFSALLCSLLLIQGNGTPILAIQEEAFEPMGDAIEEIDNESLEEIERVSIDEETISSESSNIVHSGALGTARWTIDSNGTLTIGEGTFKITYGYGHYKNKNFSWPWAQFIDEITHVDGTAPFTAIGDYNRAFTSISSLKTPSITSIDLSGWDTSQVTKMYGMFNNCSSLTSINLSGWDFSSTKDVQYMFANCSSLTSLELLGWKFPSFEEGSRDFLDLGGLFKNCTSLTSLNLSGWDISSPRKDMLFMFEGCSSLTSLNLSGWDTTSIVYFNYESLFKGAENLYKIIYSASGQNMFDDLSIHNSWKWYQNGNGPYAISQIPPLSQGEQGLLIREDHSEEKDNWGNLDNSGNSNPLGSGVVSSYGAMQRLYNPNSGEHFYTGDANERNHLVSIGWKDEGIAWQAPETSTTPVYRLYSSTLQDHHYTTDSNEKDSLTKLGWKYEGISWYSDDQKGTPLYRLYNKNVKKAGAHHYTTDQNERDTLVRQGWKDEGVAWYGLASDSSTTPSPTPNESLNLNAAYLCSTGTGGWGEILRIDENNHFRGSYSDNQPPSGAAQIDYYSYSGDIVDIQKVGDKKYTGKLANIKREDPDPAWLNNGSPTKKVEVNNFTAKEGDLVTIYLADLPTNKMDSKDEAWISIWGYKNLPGTYIVNSRTGYGYCSWFADQDSSTPSQGSQTPPTSSAKEKYKMNYIMKVRSQPNYEGEQIGRKEEGAVVEIVKTVAGSNNSVWGQLVEGGWICLKDADLVYGTKIG